MVQSIREFKKEVGYIKTDIEVIKSNYATKADIQLLKAELHKELTTQTWKIVLALIVTVSIALLSEYFIV